MYKQRPANLGAALIWNNWIAETEQGEDAQMGFPCEINYILRLRAEQGLDESHLKVGDTYDFSKDGHRIYPIDAPIDLGNEAWEIVARVVVREMSVGNGSTSGRYQVLRIYSSEEKSILTRLNQDGEEANKRLRQHHP